MSDQTIDSLEKTGFQVLPAQMAAGDARTMVQPGQAIIVLQAPDGQPLGVIAPAQVAALAGSPRPLVEYHSHWQPPTFVLPGTLVIDVLYAMRSDKSIRWLVILRGEEVIGLVSSDTLFDLSRGGAVPKGDLAMAEAVHGDPLTPPSGLCYLCSAEPPHHIPPERVEDRTADGRALCPCDGSRMVGTFVCPKEFLPC